MIHKLNEEVVLEFLKFVNFHDFSQIIINKKLHYLSKHTQYKKRRYKFFMKLVKINLFQIKNILNSKINIFTCEYSKKLLNLVENIQIEDIINNKDIIKDLKNSHFTLKIRNTILCYDKLIVNLDSITRIQNMINS